MNANAADQQQGQVPISFNQYSSSLIGQGFETLARRRRRVGEVSREHEWADAADFATKNNFVMAAYSAGQLDGAGEEGERVRGETVRGVKDERIEATMLNEQRLPYVLSDDFTRHLASLRAA